jgi:hypothetical protein
LPKIREIQQQIPTPLQEDDGARSGSAIVAIEKDNDMR